MHVQAALGVRCVLVPPGDDPGQQLLGLVLLQRLLQQQALRLVALVRELLRVRLAARVRLLAPQQPVG